MQKSIIGQVNDAQSFEPSTYVKLIPFDGSSGLLFRAELFINNDMMLSDIHRNALAG